MSGSDAGRHRIEIVHESLLSHWPRLVRWQTQDADGAQLREQLRQAAAAWSDRGRPDDLLWSGTAFREYAVWRERYGGRLTALEEEFAQAMRARDRRHRLRRAVAIAGAFAALVVTLLVTLALWRRSEAAREIAAAEARRAEAARFVALGRAALGDDSTNALAFAIKSLEIADTPAARDLAVEALAAGPVAFDVIPPAGGNGGFSFSPDGRWLATVGEDRRLTIWTARGGAPRRSPPEAWVGPERFDVRFVTGDLVMARHRDGTATVFSASTGAPIRSLRHECGCRAAGGMIYTCHSRGAEFVFVRTPAGQDRGTEVARISRRPWLWDVDPKGRWILVGDDRGLDLLPLAGGPRRLLTAAEVSSPRRDEEDEDERYLLAISGDGTRAAIETGASIRVFDVTAQPAVVATLRRERDPDAIAFDSAGRRVASATNLGVEIWDLDAPPDAAPLKVGASAVALTFDPSGSWLASMDQIGDDAKLWSLDDSWPYVLQIPDEPRLPSCAIGFSDDSQSLVTMHWFADSVGIWPITPGQTHGRIIRTPSWAAALDREGRLVTTGQGGPVILWSTADGSRRELGVLRPHDIPLSADFSLDGTLVAVGTQSARGAGTIFVFDLRSGASWRLEANDPLRANQTVAATIISLAFIRDGRLVASGNGAIRIWDARRQKSRIVRRLDPGTTAWMSVSDDGRRMAVVERQLDDERRVDDPGPGPRTLFLCDVPSLRCRALRNEQVVAAVVDSTGRIVARIGPDGVVRVSAFEGGPEHRLFASKGPAVGAGLAISPDGRWIAARTSDLRLWRMPDLTKPPLQELPLDELLRTLKRKTNVRIVGDTPTANQELVSWEPPG